MIARALVAFALLFWPAESRAEYRAEIAADVASRGLSAGGVLNLIGTGMRLRAETFWRDLVYSLARLRRAPLFVAIVVATFALGIGANVAVFSAFNAIVLRPLPFPNADRLVTVAKRVAPRTDGQPLAAADVGDLRAQLHGVSSIAGIVGTSATTVLDGTPKSLVGKEVSTGFFGTIGATPEIGRFFEAADARAGRRSVVISDRLWRTSFNGEFAALGAQLVLEGTPYTVVGVASAQTQAPEPWGGTGGTLDEPDYYTVLSESAANGRGIGGSLGAIAALAPGTSVAQLNAELAVVSPRVQSLYPRNALNRARITFVAQPLAQQLIGPAASSLWLVLLAVFGILVVACANVANVIGARWSAREREIAVRRALGASRRRIAAQLFIETGLLALGGGIAGVALAYAGLRIVPLTALDAMPRAHAIAIDATTLLYALLIVGATTFLAGLAPVLALGRTALPQVLSSAGRTGDASRGHRLRSLLVVAEVAIALALVISSGLLVRSLIALLHAPAGFRTEGVYESESFTQVPFDQRQDWAREGAQQQRLLARIQSLPGADAAALSVAVPLIGAFGVGSEEVAGTVTGAQCARDRGPFATHNIVSPDYFRALGIPLLRGRAFTGADTAGGAPVAVVSEGFAAAFFHGADAVGQRIRPCGFHDKWTTVVGVVRNVPQRIGIPPLPIVYEPLAQHPPPLFSVVMYAPHLDPAAARNEIRSAFAAVFPDKPPPEVHTVSGVVALMTRQERSAAGLLSALALVPLLLALSGIYGVVSFSVEQRTREFGVRIALGARAPSILGGVLRRALATTALGVAAGTALAALDARAIAPYLTVKPDMAAAYAGLRPQAVLSPLDPVTFGGVIVLIFACAAVAALIPALRATRVDPVVALRYE